MPLTKEQKTAAVEAITGQLKVTPMVYLTDYKGLTVEQANDLRRRFRASGVEYKVVKNTLLRRAMEGLGGYDDLYDHLHGPTAVAFSEEPAAPARVIKKFTKDTRQDLPELKIAYIDGAIYEAGQLDALAALKSKNELVGDVIGLLMAPISNVVGALEAQGTNLAALLNTLLEEGES